jgi:hypothetical protein
LLRFFDVVQLRTTILENLRQVRPVSGEGSVVPSIPQAAAAHITKQQQVSEDDASDQETRSCQSYSTEQVKIWCADL